LDDLKDLETRFNDPVSILFDDDEDKPKKKKKKDKEKKKEKSESGSDSYKESLKELSKKELRKKAEKMGIDLSDVDTDSKKAMRKAIMKVRNKAVKPEQVWDGTDEVKESLKPAGKLKQVDPRPPYYYDEDSEDFVIAKALETDDMACFQAMRSLGKMRQEKRPDDGFGELMERITQKINEVDVKQLEAPAKKESHKDAIDVEYREVKDEKPLKDTQRSAEAVELSPEEVAKFAEDVDKALSAIQDKKSDGQPQKKRKKK
jgi:hypothetical protein